jgi:tetratricopeptide (TPR) repeat protein
MFPGSTFGSASRGLLTAIGLLLFLMPAAAEDKGIQLNLPKKSKPTPVQKLNRDGVKAIEHHDYDRARKLFYKAYLLDPNDPFTLNNMGYLSELEGDRETANYYYAKAEQAQHRGETVTVASRADAEGRPVGEVAGQADAAVDTLMKAEQERKRNEGGPIELHPRPPANPSAPPPLHSPGFEPAPDSSSGEIRPTPSSANPADRLYVPRPPSSTSDTPRADVPRPPQ